MTKFFSVLCFIASFVIAQLFLFLFCLSTGCLSCKENAYRHSSLSAELSIQMNYTQFVLKSLINFHKMPYFWQNCMFISNFRALNVLNVFILIYTLFILMYIFFYFFTFLSHLLVIYYSAVIELDCGCFYLFTYILILFFKTITLFIFGSILFHSVGVSLLHCRSYCSLCATVSNNKRLQRQQHKTNQKRRTVNAILIVMALITDKLFVFQWLRCFQHCEASTKVEEAKTNTMKRWRGSIGNVAWKIYLV